MADNSAGPLPLFLSLARWANAPAAEDPISLLAADCAGSGSGVDAGVLRAALQAAKDKEGPGLVLLLDGLDEVDNSAKSKLLERVLGRIRQLLHEWPETALVVSSRLTGYPGRPAEDFVECRLSPLDQGRQRDLLAHWLGADLANRALARIAERVRLAELAGNPLLLTLLAKLFQGAPEKALPATRGQLYQAAIKVLLEQGHGIDRTGMEQPISARDILRPLAWRLLAAGGAAWSEELINRILRKEVKADEDLLLNLRLNFGGSEAFLTQVRQRGGVLGDHDGAGQPWRFLHRSLGEQLAAEAMAATNAWNPATLLPDLAEEGGLDRWGETISLLTGLLKQDDPRRAELLQAIARHSHDLATRLLPQLEGLGIEEAWTLLEQVPKEEYDPYPWDGVDLAALLRSLAADGHPIDVLEASLLKRAKPLLARAKKSNRGEYLERAAHLLFALEQLQLLHAVEPRPSPLHRPAAVQAATQRFFEALGIQPPEPEWIPRAIRVPAKGPTVTFAMGSQDGVGQDDEHPLRPEVVLSAFALGITPVTEAQFRRLEGTPPPKGKENHPVTGVSWWQAWLYCRWVGGQLPSEAHWECAARAGTDTLWPTGNTPEDLEKQAWFDGGKGKGADQTHPVAKLQANPWGFHDLLGNVWEWCADFYGPYDPAKREDPAGPPSGAHRVLRGGSAWNDAARCRPGQRVRYWPWDRNVNGGFRVAFPCS
jgi:formylglycine-generating enzyme required for sulfatase activity